MKSSLYKFRFIAIVPVVLILVGIAAFFGLRKTITLSVDGETRQVTTYAFRVADLLGSQSIALSTTDLVSPTLSSWLKNGQAVTLIRAIPVQILADGKNSSLYSAERVPSSLLSEAGIIISAADQILSNGRLINPDQPFPPDSPSISLQVLRAIAFHLTENGKGTSLTSASPTLGSALWAAGYSLYAADELVPSADSPLHAGLSVTLTLSAPVTIHTYSGDVKIRTSARSVGEALEDAHLTPQDLDYSLPTSQEPIPATRSIRLIRVTEQVLVEESPTPFKTEYQPDAEVDLDSQSVIQAGEYGLSAERVRVRYEDGVEASRKVDSSWVAREPVTRIIGYGTNVVMHTAEVDGVTIQYWRALSMYATSYHPSEVGDTTASGLPLQKGIAAIDRSVVPFYTELYIPGYGKATAADTGGGVIGRWIDLGYSDSDYVPWHSWVTVYFLWPPPDNIVWIVP